MKEEEEACRNKLRKLIYTMRIFPDMSSGIPGPQRDAGEILLLLIQTLQRTRPHRQRGIAEFCDASFLKERRCVDCQGDWSREFLDPIDNCWLTTLENPSGDEVV